VDCIFNCKFLLPPPSSICNRPLSLSNFAQKLRKLICMNFSGKVGNGPMNKWLNFGGDPDHSLDTGIVFQICHYWEIWKVVKEHSFILIRQMAALLRRALEEVCTVPVFLVNLEVALNGWRPTGICLQFGSAATGYRLRFVANFWWDMPSKRKLLSICVYCLTLKCQLIYTKCYCKVFLTQNIKIQKNLFHHVYS